MKIKINETVLKSIATKLEKGIKGNSRNAQDGYLFWEICDNELMITANEGTFKIVVQVDCDIYCGADTKFWIDGKTFIALANKALTDTEITVDIDKLHIESGAIKANIQMADFETYVVSDMSNFAQTITINTKDMQTALAQTLPFVAFDNTRPILTGINISYDKQTNALAFVALDGFRLAKVSTNAEMTITEDINITIPNKAMYALLAILKSTSETTLTLSFAETKCTIAIGDTKVYSNIFADRFMNYNNILNAMSNKSLTVDVTEIKNAIDIIKIVSGDNNANVCVLEIDNGNISLSAKKPTADGVVTVKGDCANFPDSFRIAFNSNFLYSAFNSCTTDTATIWLKEPNSVAKIISDNAVFVVLPVRLIV